MNQTIKEIFYEDGSIKEKIPYSGKKKQGTLKKYNKKGIVIMSVDYCDDKINGLVKSYYDDGQLESVESYTKGKRQNDLKIYNRDGFLTYSSDRTIEPDYSECSYMKTFESRHF